VSDQALRFAGRGVADFVSQLLATLFKQGHRFHTLSQLHEMLPVTEFLLPEDETAGRAARHSADDYHRYWTLSDGEKQAFIKESYEKRNATDPYATSRDYNAKDLEIKTIRASLKGEGPILDLGCGNGTTLLSLARELESWPMTGVDFSESLIRGAGHLLEQQARELVARPQFICDDAVQYLRLVESESVAYVLTERFLQNLPSGEVQKAVMREAHRVLRPGGRLLMCEGSADGFESLNRLRTGVGLSSIPDTSADNVSAIRLRDDDIESFAAEELGFVLVSKLGASIYFIIARALHPLLVMPQRPRFDARINDLAARIQEAMPFTPGYGSNTLWVFEKPSSGGPVVPT